MNDATPAWVSAGTGLTPQLRWSFRTDAPLVGLATARESGDVFVADQSGAISRLDRTGHLFSLTQGLRQLRALSWCDTGEAGAVLLGDSQLLRLNQQMEVDWSVSFPDPVLDVAVAPYGDYVAVSLASGRTRILSRSKRDVGALKTLHPLRFLELLLLEPALVGAAEYGLLCRHQMTGREVWSEQVLATVGDLAVSGSGDAILLAAHHYGIQRHGHDGRPRSSHALEGTVNRIAASIDAQRIAAATLERHLYWLDANAHLLWTTQTDEPVHDLLCDPVGEWIIVGFDSGCVVRLDWGSPPARGPTSG